MYLEGGLEEARQLFGRLLFNSEVEHSPGSLIGGSSRVLEERGGAGPPPRGSVAAATSSGEVVPGDQLPPR